MTEQFDEFWIRLAARVGLQHTAYVRSNSAANNDGTEGKRLGKGDFSPTERSGLEAATSLDVRTHALAAARAAAQRDAAGAAHAAAVEAHDAATTKLGSKTYVGGLPPQSKYEN